MWPPLPRCLLRRPVSSPRTFGSARRYLCTRGSSGSGTGADDDSSRHGHTGPGDIVPGGGALPQHVADFEKREEYTRGTLSFAKSNVNVPPVRGPPGSIQKVAAGQVLLELEQAFRADPHMDAVNKIAYRYAKEGGLSVGAVEYVNHALKLMDDEGVKPDLFTYNQLLDVLPKDGKLKNKRLFDVLLPAQTEHHECALQLLTRMEERGFIPDLRTFKILEATFGRSSQPLEKCEALAWWFLRIQSDNPYIMPESLPESRLEQAKLALNHLGIDSKGRFRRLSVIARLPRSMKTKKLWQELHNDELNMAKFRTRVYRGPEDNTDQTAVASHTNNYGASVAPTSTATHPALARPDVGYVVGMQTTRQLEEMAYYTTVESSHRRYTEKYVPTMTWKESRRDWSSEEQRKEYIKAGKVELMDGKQFDKGEETGLFLRGPHLNWFCRKLVPIYTLVEDIIQESPQNGFGTKERVMATCVIDTRGKATREELLEDWVMQLGVTVRDVVLDLGPEHVEPVQPALLGRSDYERTEAKRNAEFLQAAAMPVESGANASIAAGRQALSGQSEVDERAK